MRFLTAAILFVVSAALLLVGIAERTIWHPPAIVSHSLEIHTTAPFIVVDHSALTDYEGNPTVTITSDAYSFLSVGRQSDIKAWLGQTPHVQVSAARTKNGVRQLRQETIAGSGESANPVGSDLWREQVSAPGHISAVVNVSDSAALLIASNGFTKAPGSIHISWPVVFDPTQSRLLIIAGTLLLLAAVVVNWWAWYQMRKERGPRRRTPKAPHGPKMRRKRQRTYAPNKGRRSARNFAVVAAASMAVLSLTGCTETPVATATPTGQTSIQQPPVVTQPQLEEIIKRVAASVAAADAAHDPKLLEARVAGPALTSRTAYYILQKASKKVADLPPIATAHINLALPAATKEWPRTIMAITSTGASDTLPQMVVLQQGAPREPYKLWYDIDMLPGVKLPPVNTVQAGAIPVAPDSLFLKIAPNAIPSRFGDLLDLGSSSQSAMMFNVSNDEYYQQIAASLKSQQKTLANATISVTHGLGDPNVISLSTVNSGALVAVFMTDNYVIKPKNRTQAVAVSGNEKLLLGAAGSATGVRSTYGSMLLFYVPANRSDAKDQIMTLGATQVLLKVASL